MSKATRLSKAELEKKVADYEKEYPQYTTEYIIECFEQDKMILDDMVLCDWATYSLMLRKLETGSE